MSNEAFLKGMVREYVLNPFEPERLGIICDYLEDREDYRLDRVRWLQQTYQKAEQLGRDIKESDYHLLNESAVAVCNFPMVGITAKEVRRPLLCAMFRFMPMPLLEVRVSDRNIVEVELFDSNMPTAWQWMWDVRVNHVPCLHGSVVAGEMVFCHLMEQREVQHIPGYRHNGRLIDYYRDVRSEELREHLRSFYRDRWTQLEQLASACSAGKYMEMVRDLDLSLLGNIERQHQYNSVMRRIIRAFNYNLWSIVFGVAPPVPQPRKRK